MVMFKYKKNMMNKQNAFTLAEVLITLGIIGTVAAMTIPTLIANYQKEQVVTKLKQGYGIFVQAFNNASSDYGCRFGDLFTYESSSLDAASRNAITTNFVQSYVLPYVKINKDCGFTRGGECTISRKTLAGVSAPVLSWEYLILLTNGMSVSFVPNNDGSKWRDMIINIDINGSKQPNIYGKDVFEMLVASTSKKLMFNWQIIPRANLLNNCKIGGSGSYCGALILNDGWKISDDYPWP